MFKIKLKNWIIPFNVARLLVTHDGRKLTRVGELSLAERLQGRYGNGNPFLGSVITKLKLKKKFWIHETNKVFGVRAGVGPA